MTQKIPLVLILIFLGLSACQYPETCNDGDLNGDETGIDCGGVCGPCFTCEDGVRNQDELRIDCGGTCPQTCSDQWSRYKFERYLGYPTVVNFVTKAKGYAWGDEDFFYKTNDGGLSWTQVEVPYRIKFLGASENNPDRIFLKGVSGAMLFSDNEGQSWESTNYDKGWNRSLSLDFFNETEGILYDYDIYKTTDGGKTFQIMYEESLPFGAAFANTKCFKSGTSIIASYYGIYRSTNRGEAWMKIENAPRLFYNNHEHRYHVTNFLNDNIGFLYGYDEHIAENVGIWKTENGGIDWQLKIKKENTAFDFRKGFFQLNEEEGLILDFTSAAPRPGIWAYAKKTEDFWKMTTPYGIAQVEENTGSHRMTHGDIFENCFFAINQEYFVKICH